MGYARWEASDWARYTAVKATKTRTEIFRSDRVPRDFDPSKFIGRRESRDSVPNPNSNAIVIGADVTGSCRSLVLASEFQHFIRHIQTVGFAAWGNTARGKQDVDAAATSQVEDRFAGLSSASAVGLPQPSEARSALCGS